jgi:hypothetical protein
MDFVDFDRLRRAKDNRDPKEAGLPAIAEADGLVFDTLADMTDLARGYIDGLKDAVAHGDRLRVRLFAGQLSRVIRTILITSSDLFGPQRGRT